MLGHPLHLIKTFFSKAPETHLMFLFVDSSCFRGKRPQTKPNQALLKSCSPDMAQPSLAKSPGGTAHTKQGSARKPSFLILRNNLLGFVQIITYVKSLQSKLMIYCHVFLITQHFNLPRDIMKYLVSLYLLVTYPTPTAPLPTRKKRNDP